MRLGRSLRILSVASAFTLATTADAQQRSYAEIAGGAAYGYCPEYLAREEVPFETHSTLKALGFRGPAQKATRQQVELTMMSLPVGDAGDERPLTDGVMVAVMPGSSYCQVMVVGPQAAAAKRVFADRVRELDYDLQPDPAGSRSMVDEPLTVTAMKAMVNDAVLHVQLIDATTAPHPMASFVIFSMEQ